MNFSLSLFIFQVYQNKYGMKLSGLILLIMFTATACYDQSAEDDFDVQQIIRANSIDALNLSQDQKMMVLDALYERYNKHEGISRNNEYPNEEVLNHLDILRRAFMLSYANHLGNEKMRDLKIHEIYQQKISESSGPEETRKFAQEHSQVTDSIYAYYEEKIKIW